MATKEERIKEKRDQAIAKSRGNSGEPIVTQARYNIELMLALNYYAREDDKDKRKWVKTYLERNNLINELELLSSAPDWMIAQIGALSRIINNGNYLSEEHTALIKNKFKQVYTYKQNKLSEEAKVVLTPKVDVNTPIFEQCLTDIDLAIDGKQFDFDLAAYIAHNNIPIVVSKRISKYYEPQLKELDLIDTDTELQEAYSYLSARQLKSFKVMISNIINTSKQAVVTNKAPRKARKVKEKPPAVIVSKLKYMKEFTGFNQSLISAKATDIIGAKEVWLFNTKTRIVIVYKALSVLSVKGTSITGYDVSTSKQKRLRKPEVFLSGSLARVAINKSFNELTTIEATPNGRVNEDMVILRVF